MRINLLLGLTFIFVAVSVKAATPTWKINHEKSQLIFTATQNNAPISGRFTQFDGDIRFDPVNLQQNHVRILVDLNSVHTSYAEISDTLKTPEWFNVKTYPQAIFIADHFKETSKDHYQAEGTLTIRNKKLPLVVKFIAEDLMQDKARVRGEALLRRTSYGIGQGEWSATNEIKDEVKIQFVLSVDKIAN